MTNRGENLRYRVEQPAHLEQLGRARMLRLGWAEGKLVVVKSTHRGPRRFSGWIDVFPEKTDSPSILFPFQRAKFSFVFNNLAFPDAI